MDSSIILIKEEPRGPSQLVELVVSANGSSRVPFPDVQQLRSQVGQNVIIKTIRLITLDVATFGTITGQPNAPLAELKKASLVLYCEGWEKAQYIPLLVLNDVATPAGTFGYRNNASDFNDWQNVDWSKSYIQYANTQVSAGAPYCFIFDIVYQKLNANGGTIIGPS